ncbi:proline racemase family protein [Rhizobium sp. NXC24]|uniref:proline racemase family protein n=1 Tax=Rhizobium sp. NXC24 TaxID=2048897 RepID=UPI000CDF5676|nr:proline racemase family protein [Rhizobium sp. NXC24]AVA21340.1 proline racemase protein [Rhizobium sp. NXC24]
MAFTSLSYQIAGTVDVVDVHVGGDLHRIVLGGVKEPPGRSVFEKMHFIKEKADGLRKLLLHEPRGGHPSLFADLVVAPSAPNADAGFIIMELMGYPLISGTNTMSTAIALLETGRLKMSEGINNLVLEAPGGLIEVDALCRDGKVKRVSYRAKTPSYVAGEGLSVDIPGFGEVKFDLIWTGAFYPIFNAAEFGFSLVRDEEEEIVALARKLVPAMRSAIHPLHPVYGDEGPISFVLFAGEAEEVGDCWERRVCCYEFPRNSVCRAPAGVPSTAVMVQLVHRGQLKVGDTLRTKSVFDSELKASILDLSEYHGHVGVRAEVSGSGWITAKSQLVVDLNDPLTPLDGLADILVGSE